MKQTICDKCGMKTEGYQTYNMFDCFGGSLSMDDFDLCDKCWKELQEVINKFTKNEK